MEETPSAQEGQEALKTLDWSLVFLLLLVAAIVISITATSAQREGLFRSLFCASSEETPDVFPLRCKASALSVGALGFFAVLARRSLQQAQAQGDCAQKRSAQANALASALVLAAALIRLDDLEFIKSNRQSAALADSLTPE